MLIKSLWHINKEESEIREEILKGKYAQDYRVIKTQYSMISTGTEYLVSSGLIPDQFHSKMSVPYMGGTFCLPVKYGYACCGMDEDDNLFHFMHPHQSMCLVNQKDLFQIERLPPYKAPLISNMETVLNAIWDAEIKPIDRIAIIGYGNIGSLLAETILNLNNRECVIIENDPIRVDLARKNDLECQTEFRGKFDIIFNTSSSGEALNQGLKLLREEGRIVELSWFANKSVSLNLGEHFHYNRLRIISSQVSKIPINKRKHMTYEKRKDIAVALLKNEGYDKLITNIINLEDAPKFFKKLRKNKYKEGLIYLIKY